MEVVKEQLLLGQLQAPQDPAAAASEVFFVFVAAAENTFSPGRSSARLGTVQSRTSTSSPSKSLCLRRRSTPRPPAIATLRTTPEAATRSTRVGNDLQIAACVYQRQ
jgi:hypothetical protein